jgi:hypothetical protein
VDTGESVGGNVTFNIPAAASCPAGRKLSIVAADIQLGTSGYYAYIESAGGSDKLYTPYSIVSNSGATNKLVDDNNYASEGAPPITLVSDGVSRWVSTDGNTETTGEYWDSSV